MTISRFGFWAKEAKYITAFEAYIRNRLCYTAMATPSDLFFHIRAEWSDLCVELEKLILHAFGGAVTGGVFFVPSLGLLQRLGGCV